MSTTSSTLRPAVAALVLAALLMPVSTSAAVVPSRIHLGLTPVVSGLSSPLLVTHAGDGSGRLFVVEQTGKVRIVEDGSLVAVPFIDLSRSVSNGGSRACWVLPSTRATRRTASST